MDQPLKAVDIEGTIIVSYDNVLAVNLTEVVARLFDMAFPPEPEPPEQGKLILLQEWREKNGPH